MPSPESALRDRVLAHIEKIWGTRDFAIADQFIEAVGMRADTGVVPQTRWDERDVVLITDGDSVIDGNEAPLTVLNRLIRRDLTGAISTVHVLPFCPSSSDRGFSVVDYAAVDPALGTWDDLATLGESATLMFDLVLNHCSARSQWFEQFLADTEPGRSYIKTGDESWDLTDVVRPRSLPLLSTYETAVGTKAVWTTFSRDQVDLDWSNPDLVAEMLRIIDLYIRGGARFLRLDAVAYIWKVPGTTSIHLPETHEMVKLVHTLLAHRAPGVSIITETNVPDRENRTYFGDADEAHLIYNFTLPPLAIDAVLNGRADRLVEWIDNAPPPPPGTTLFNFLASHDGIGVRPAEGFLTREEIDGLVELVAARGGLHGTYRRGDEDRPYELNISFPDLFGGPEDPYMIDRIVVLHTIVLALAGIPAMYINSLLGTTNDNAAVEADGVRRSINRGRVPIDDVPQLDGSSWRSRLYRRLLERAALRRRHPAFHPEGAQSLRDLGGVLAIDRTAPRDRIDEASVGAAQVTVLANMVDQVRRVQIDGECRCLLTNEDHVDEIELAPYGSAWLVSRSS